MNSRVILGAVVLLGFLGLMGGKGEAISPPMPSPPLPPEQPTPEPVPNITASFSDVVVV